jgi:IS30 family transposase
MKYKHLTREERHTISCLRHQAYSTAQIAEAVSKHPSTIRREFKRNPSHAGKYDFRQAHNQARHRSRTASCRAARIDPESWAFAIKKLKNEQWSPDQISGELAKQGRPTISHEAIYLRIYADRMRCGKLHIHLRHRVKSYRSRALKNEKRGRIKNQTSIDERPRIVEARTRIGDWEIGRSIRLSAPIPDRHLFWLLL